MHIHINATGENGSTIASKNTCNVFYVLGNISFEGSIDTVNSKIIRQFPAISDTLNKVSIGTPIDIVLKGGN